MKKFLSYAVYPIILFMLISVAQFAFSPTVSAEGAGKLVYVIPIENEVERGLEAFLRRTTREASEAFADHIIFEINTPGGSVEAADSIGQIMQDISIPTTAYIRSRALSAGSYIALFADTIYMNPQATMGASGIITADGSAADAKAQSYWREAMGSAAEASGRDRIYAEAMADASIDLPEYNAPEGQFLTLGPTKAIEVGYSEGTVNNRSELLNVLGLSGATVIEAEISFAENVARFLTNSLVVSILLTLAGLGLVIELYSPGFGVAGSVSIISLALFFYGHAVAGLAGMEVFVLLIIGIGLIVAEFFVPGGILGGIGVMSIIGSLFFATDDIFAMGLSVLTALMITITVAVILYRKIGLQKGFMRHIVLSDRETLDRGYVSVQERKELIGLRGSTITPLRPSGTGLFDGNRIDIVSEGNFIMENQAVEIVKVNGSRVVVKEIKNEEE
ncbi:NfeD family protein [Alkalibacter saccharofermentans]|uniref:Membrane-bound serine protease (ClpP class) n=1 Tax=Alkalibacter saccharofermentans DSM 14828 TaxID=1120975 RepID=A0A1M4ZCK5_9FIRM|nr:nodulation protein NfeD [Alkalibacter saccharofermentans]SHF15678.1 membrane-bound serine protease (ClpP class) [Alkalibacter saccharofermentans DSM 14828]